MDQRALIQSSMEQVQHVNDLENLLNIVNQIVYSLKIQIKEFLKELSKLEKVEDPKHALAMLLLEDTDNGEKKRGPKPTNVIIGPISTSFELPEICFQRNIDIDAVLATVHPEHHCRFSIAERAKNWKIQYRRRSTNRGRYMFCDHLPSNLRLRSHEEIVRYILYEILPKSKTTSRKRKLAIVMEDDEREEDIQLEDDYFFDNLDDIFANILEEIEMEISNTGSGQMVGERTREMQNSDCMIVEGYSNDFRKIEEVIDMSKDPFHLYQPHRQYFYQPNTLEALLHSNFMIHPHASSAPPPSCDLPSNPRFDFPSISQPQLHPQF